MSIPIVLSKQNPDGGWPYVRGKSCTEPTAYAVIALLSAGEREAASRGLRWIATTQRSDGGFPPQAGVDESTWVTALVTLLPPETVGANVHARAVRWLMSMSGQETSTLYRFRQRLLGAPSPSDQKFAGWPWAPGAAAWVGPTAVAVLALEKEWQRNSAMAVRERMEEGRNFLLARMCQTGGWNHGSARPLGYDSRPYPETTGMALAALRGLPAEKLRRSIDLALHFLSESRSADEINWLRLGLLAHGRLPQGFRPPENVACRTLSETTIRLVVEDAEKGRGIFWS